MSELFYFLADNFNGDGSNENASKAAADIRSASWSFLIAVIIPIFIYALGYFLNKWVRRRSETRREKEAAAYEALDIIRHLTISEAILWKIYRERDLAESQKKIFSYTHIQKLSFTRRSADFPLDLYRKILPKYVGELGNLKLRVRNVEIDVAEFRMIYRRQNIAEIYDNIPYLMSQFRSSIEKTKSTLIDNDFISPDVVYTHISDADYKAEKAKEKDIHYNYKKTSGK